MSDTTTHTTRGRLFTAVRKTPRKALIAGLTGLIGMGGTAALLAGTAAVSAPAGTVAASAHPIYMQIDGIQGDATQQR